MLLRTVAHIFIVAKCTPYLAIFKFCRCLASIFCRDFLAWRIRCRILCCHIYIFFLFLRYAIRILPYLSNIELQLRITVERHVNAGIPQE
ncbi:hypothetical protein F5Y10DRAFT_232505 [Nemania abortiva]|nr:hypothetical protein F5Y10DRAFT_232505 [Nemania abortiva]